MMGRPALLEAGTGCEDGFRLRLRVGPEDLLFEPLRHCRNSSERGRMLRTFALRGYLASMGIQVDQQLQAVIQAGGLVATLTDLRDLAGNLATPVTPVPVASSLKAEPAMPAFTHSPAGSSTAASVPVDEPARPNNLSGLDALALGGAVQI